MIMKILNALTGIAWLAPPPAYVGGPTPKIWQNRVGAIPFPARMG